MSYTHIKEKSPTQKQIEWGRIALGTAVFVVAVATSFFIVN
jgi:hypothetical protein